MRRGERIRLLVTGFTPFPGAPVNPTEHLIRHFEARPPLSGEGVDFRFAVLPVDYAAAIPALDAAAEDFRPHVAVHFGLAEAARGFRLETTARNAVAARQPDNAGRMPDPAPIRPDGGDVPSMLPLSAIAAALDARGLPVEWSDDAGGYLCNFVFFHSAAGLCGAARAPISGFVHVGPVNLPGSRDTTAGLDFAQLIDGAGAILAVCAEHARGTFGPAVMAAGPVGLSCRWNGRPRPER